MPEVGVFDPNAQRQMVRGAFLKMVELGQIVQLHETFVMDFSPVDKAATHGEWALAGGMCIGGSMWCCKVLLVWQGLGNMHEVCCAVLSWILDMGMLTLQAYTCTA